MSLFQRAAMAAVRTLLLPLAPLLLGSAAAGAAVNDRPIIGILTEPRYDPRLGAAQYNRTYMAASYVKFVESAGGRVVPLHFDAPDAELRALFGQINGLILPGGGVNVRDEPGNRFFAAGKLLFDLALEANTRGDAFPVFGICLGFQLLSVIVARRNGVLCEGCFKTEGTPLPLRLTAGASGSRLFAGMPAALRAALTTQNITENSHVSGVTPETYAGDANLRSFFEVLSTNTDPVNGRDFVSTVEAKHFPIAATQWHPEKNLFEWAKIGRLGFKAIPHSADAVRLSQHLANAFVEAARLSPHRFASEAAEAAALMYNFSPVPDPRGYFAQIYLWDRSGRLPAARARRGAGAWEPGLVVV